MAERAGEYDKRPVVAISDDPLACAQGWTEIGARLQARQPRRGERACWVVELYPGLRAEDTEAELRTLFPDAQFLGTEAAFHPPARLREIFADTLTADPVFNRMRGGSVAAYFEPAALEELQQRIADAPGLVIVLGTGASHVVAAPDLVLSANVSRWELQRRQRAHRIPNLGLRNATAPAAELYKIAYFLDWRIGDDLRHGLYARADFFLDFNDGSAPRMLAGELLREAVRTTVQRPFRVVPFFDPGPWGGQWMRRQFDLDPAPSNFAWAFDCVPEENSVLLGFGERCFELPAIVLVHEEPKRLLGDTVLGRFGAEFPIRFDLLDTVEGGNLSLQVHPSDAYIREHFGMRYTQDESYYILHAEPGSELYLGLREDVDRARMAAALATAARGGTPFPADHFIARWPTVTHDHFSIPAGTVHCSGAGNVVLEISATPYIFTFKLWDWGRTGLNGQPRPIHLEHGLANISWDRTRSWTARELIDQAKTLATGEGWFEERTGLHRSQFLETRRHWFSVPVPHDTAGNLNVLNLVAGSEAVVRSPHDRFAPVPLHYAETLIVPACVGGYEIAPVASRKGETTPYATVKAYVRP